MLIDILTVFKKKEKEIGKQLIAANRESMTQAQTIGPCPSCGGTLMIKKGKFGFFIACDRYPECKVTFRLPSTGKVVPSDKVCEHCHHPLIKIIRKRPQEICLNPACPSKKAGEKEAKEMQKVADGSVTKTCPKCKTGKLVPRQSVYGPFYGCSNYPKCRHTEKV
ncbi:MAG: topoisomerase DNA-binding C4 zinc finger domain-containing protein [Nanoarchaeota archaeon]